MSPMFRDARSFRRRTRLELCLSQLQQVREDRPEQNENVESDLADWQSRWPIRRRQELAWRLQVIDSQLDGSLTKRPQGPRLAAVDT